MMWAGGLILCSGPERAAKKSTERVDKCRSGRAELLLLLAGGPFAPSSCTSRACLFSSILLPDVLMPPGTGPVSLWLRQASSELWHAPVCLRTWLGLGGWPRGIAGLPKLSGMAKLNRRCPAVARRFGGQYTSCKCMGMCMCGYLTTHLSVFTQAVKLREQAAALLKKAREGRLGGRLSREEAALLRRDADRCWDEAEESIRLAEESLLARAEVRLPPQLYTLVLKPACSHAVPVGSVGGNVPRWGAALCTLKRRPVLGPVPFLPRAGSRQLEAKSAMVHARPWGAVLQPRLCCAGAGHERSHAVLRCAGPQVIAATCTRCGDPRLKEMVFRVVVIDEASQATEPSTLIPLVKGVWLLGRAAAVWESVGVGGCRKVCRVPSLLPTPSPAPNPCLPCSVGDSRDNALGTHVPVTDCCTALELL
jgi:hypothetical protein